MLINCIICNKEKDFRPALIRKGFGKYCSTKCMGIGQLGRPTWNKGLKNVQPKYWLGKKRPDLIKTGSAKTMFKKGQMSGANNPTWKGGLTEINWTFRHKWIYRKWRLKVIERDGRKCIWCDSTQDLQVDHIKKFSDYPELRLDMNNARTLCKECHRKTPTYGVKKGVVSYA